MSQTKRPKLADLKRHSPQDLAHCEGYVWHLGSRIGKGSFGEVYLGWDSVSEHSNLIVWIDDFWRGGTQYWKVVR